MSIHYLKINSHNLYVRTDIHAALPHDIPNNIALTYFNHKNIENDKINRMAICDNNKYAIQLPI